MAIRNRFYHRSVTILHSSVVRVLIPESDILISILGLGVCVLSVLSCVVSGGGPGIVLITHSRNPTLVFLFSVLVTVYYSPYRHLAHEHLGCKPWDCTLGRLNNRERKKERKEGRKGWRRDG